MTISAEEYDQIRELLKLILRRDEEGKDLTYPGMLWRDLRNAYLEKVRIPRLCVFLWLMVLLSGSRNDD